MKKPALMAKRALPFIFSLIAAVVSFGQSQEVKEDSVVYKRPFAPSLYLDYGKLLLLPSEFEQKIEGGFEFLLYEHFPIIAEVGMATLTPEGAYSNGVYESEGMYWRVGTGYVNQFLPKNKIGLTLRYGTASFSESGRISLESPSGAQGNYIYTIDRKDLTASWYEVVVYSDRHLTDLFTIGVNLRLRILASYDEKTPIDVYAIPGYGRTFDKTIPAMNFFLKITL